MSEMEYPKFSVLMSLYLKEKPEYLNEALKSVINQTVKPNEIVIVYDGPITTELKSVVEQYVSNNPGLIKIIDNPENKGLGLALADGVPQCTYELIARMDTDDICRKDRFEKQLEEFVKDPRLDICGSHILEFEEKEENIVARRRVPLVDKDIKEYQKRRDGFNHMSVMFKKKSVLAAGNYQSCLLMEDTLLWANMFMNG
ncbi:MAG TPA: glycosyltransferase, partial [Candidatus Mediterraneibacter guildfordensis]|nr:glycosyltransferase [Candidatus Mediterraneibacter guildfordensis]